MMRPVRGGENRAGSCALTRKPEALTATSGAAPAPGNRYQRLVRPCGVVRAKYSTTPHGGSTRRASSRRRAADSAAIPAHGSARHEYLQHALPALLRRIRDQAEGPEASGIRGAVEARQRSGVARYWRRRAVSAQGLAPDHFAG